MYELEREPPKEECHRCKKPIEPGEIFIWKGQKLHAHHMSCAECNKPLSNDAKEFDGKLYCPEDFAKLKIHHCANCRKPIHEQSVEVGSLHYHKVCFVCTKCQKPFVTITAFWEFQSRPYCEEHYYAMKGSVCGVCYEVASGKSKYF
jgi:predicted amidophosphoribosyltransferase